MTDSQAMMSILGHLDELRRRLIQVVIAVLGAAVIGFIFSGSVLDLLRAPLPDAYENLYFSSFLHLLTTRTVVFSVTDRPASVKGLTSLSFLFP